MKKLIYLLICIFMISSVYALGVSPGRVTIDFEAGAQKAVNFEVINSKGEDIELSLSVDGDISEYISIGSKEISISSSEESKVFSYNLNFPDSLEPGIHKGRIVITEAPKESDSGDSHVAARLAVATQVYIKVPYFGKYATSEMVIHDADEGEDAEFIFSVSNEGTFDLDSVRAEVDVYNSLDEQVSSFNTEPISILSGERRELIYDWRADVPIGEYRAVATVIYDGEVVNLEGTFSVGSRDLELKDISVNDFSLGEIVKLEMLVESKWSEPIDGAYVETQIKNDKGEVVSIFESAAHAIEPLSERVFISYWDTEDVDSGDYDAKVSINYGEKSSSKNLEFQVRNNKLTVIGLGYVISNGDGDSGSLVTVLVIVIVFLVLVNLVWFLVLRKKVKK